jgi:cell division protein FtsB
MHIPQRSFAFTLRQPSQALGLPMPVSRRIDPSAVHRALAIGILCALFVTSVGVYVSLVGRAAQRTVELRTLERQVEGLKEIVADLDQKIAREQAMPAIEARVRALGFIPIDRSEYVRVPLRPTVARD